MFVAHADAPTPLGEIQYVRTSDGADLAYVSMGSGGVALLVPLSDGITLAGLERAAAQRHFLHALGGSHQLICFDQRGFGGSRGEGSEGGCVDWEQRAGDLWSVADAAGIERAVLYGVYDAGHTIAHAAALRPDRVLGLIFNSVPPRFADLLGTSDDGVAASASAMADTTRNRDAGPAPLTPGHSLTSNVLGLNATDIAAFSRAWVEAPPSTAVEQRQGALLRRSDLSPVLQNLSAPALVLGPRRRPHLTAWAEWLVRLLPQARAVFPETGMETLGALHAFLMVLAAEVGHRASRVPVELSGAMSETRRAIHAVRRIVVPVDPEADAGRVVELACRLGEAQKAEILLVHVIPVPYTLPLEQPLPEAERRGRRALQLGEALVAEHRLPWQTRLLHERAVGAAIARVAKQEGADLIVVGLNDAGGDDARLNKRRGGESDSVGGTVRELLRRAPCEVLVDRGGPR